MENRLKVRLTGAAILVALVVLLVPEMFRGQRARDAVSTGSADGPPVRAYTIDLDGHTSAPLQNAPPPSSQPSELTPPSPPSAPSPAPPPTSTSTSGPAPAGALAAPAGVAVSTPSAAPSSPPAPKAEPAGPAGRPATAHAPVNAGTSVAAGKWTVQLGLFAKHDNAERLAKQAQAKGFAVEVSGADSHGLYRVHSSLVGDRGRALALQQQFKSQGFAASVTPP
jgi:DedD protein